MPVRRTAQPLVAIALGGVLVVLGLAGHGLEPGLLALSPALALLVPLVAGRYVGAERLQRLAARCRRPMRRPRATALVITPRAPRAALRHGRLLVGTRADRGPPAPAPARA